MQQLVQNYFPANNNKARIKRIASYNDKGVNQNINKIDQVNRPSPQLIKLMNNNNFNKNHVVFETNKPKYHFNYGQPMIKQVTVGYKNIINPPNFVQMNQNSQLNQNNFTLLPNKFQNQNLKQGDQNRQSADKRRRLKIFPQKYKDETQKNAKSNKQKQQINFLKNQILKLKEQIANKQKNKISYSINQSTNKQFNQSEIQKLQFLRTKRLTQLQNYNQSLYNQMAWKLKDIASDQYEVYLQRSKQNKMHLQELYEDSSAKKSINFKQKYNKYNDNFIDINDFQEFYQQSFKQKDSMPLKINQLSPKQQDKKVNQTVNNSRKEEQIYSPFLLIQNYKQTFKPTQNDLASNRQSFNNLKQNINETYTFHKENVQKMKNISNLAVKQIVSNKQSLQMKVIRKNVQIMKEKQIIHRKDTPQKQNPNLQIQDLNRQLESKLQRKRIQSEYAKGIYSQGKSNLRHR